MPSGLGATLIVLMLVISFVMTNITLNHFRKGIELWKASLMIMACMFTYLVIFDCISTLMNKGY